MLIINQMLVIYIFLILQPTFNEAFNTTSQPLDWISGLLDADGNQTKKYDDILNDLLKYYQDSVKLVIVEVNKRYRISKGQSNNGQSREAGNIGYTRRRKAKQNHNTICVGHHYAQTNRHNVNKT